MANFYRVELSAQQKGTRSGKEKHLLHKMGCDRITLKKANSAPLGVLPNMKAAKAKCKREGFDRVTACSMCCG